MREIQLSEYGTVQNRRRLGAQVRTWVERNLSELAENETLEVNCDGVKIMDRSFASTAFGPVLVDILTGAYGKKAMDFTNPNEDVSKALAGAYAWAGLDHQTEASHQTIPKEL